MPEHDHRARHDRELSQSLLAAAVLIALALTAWAVAGLAPTISNAVRAAFDDDDVVTVRFEAVTLGEDWGDGFSRRALPYRAFSVFDAADTGDLRQHFGISQSAWDDLVDGGSTFYGKEFVGVAKIKSRASLIAVSNRDGKTKARLQRGEYVVCVSHPFPEDNVLAVCGEFKFESDTTVSAWSDMGVLLIG